jgi:hypothetical protein
MLKGQPTIPPRRDHPLKEQALADFIKSVLKAYPDLQFEVISRGDIGGRLSRNRINGTRHPHRSLYGWHSADGA